MRLSDIDLRLLRVFMAVADAGGFVKAQGELGIGQPAISAHIANLELRLNVRLCNRGPQGFSLTNEGQKVFEETSILLTNIDSFANKLDEIGNPTVEKVTIGVVDCLVTDKNNPLPNAMHRSQNIQFNFSIYDYLDCLNELRANRIDIALVGIGGNEKLPNEFESKHLYNEVSGFYCIPTHLCNLAKTTAEVEKILNESKIAAHSFHRDPFDLNFDLVLYDDDPDISQGNVEATLYLTLGGSHVGLIPNHYAERWVQNGELVPILQEKHQVISMFHAVRLKNGKRTNLSNNFWNELAHI